MSTAIEGRPAKRSDARERLLATAAGLFYAEGINTVGVDRIVSESRVTLATFYRHFPGKEALIVGYLQAVHDAVVDEVTASAGQYQGRELVSALGAAVSSDLDRQGFRGCAFINAASEFEDPDCAVRQVVADHRKWYYDVVKHAFKQAGHDRPGNAARHFLMLRDGAMIAASLDSPTAAKRTFNRGVGGLLMSIQLAAFADPDEDDSGDS